MKNFEIYPLGDKAITIVFGSSIAPDINDRVLSAQQIIKDSLINGVLETVPTYTTLMVHYDKEKISYNTLADTIKKLLLDADDKCVIQEHRCIKLPVLYGGEYGPDIDFVAENAGVTASDVIKLHTEPEYRVYMLGFLAGFPYLGGLNPKLKSPRLSSPRVKIEPGSVGIAGMQTGAYSIASPGGWQLIGKTPLKLYDISREEPALLRCGDYVKFESISEEEFERLSKNEAGSNSKREDKSKGIPAASVINPGMLSTIQDQGRYGYRSMGVSASGAMDKASAALANMLAGSRWDAPVIESVMMGPTLRFEHDTIVAVTGANVPLKLNGEDAEEYAGIEVHSGDTLQVGAATSGMFIYIAFAGGVDAPKVLGSASTHIKSGIGEVLTKGSLINVSESKETPIPAWGGSFRTVWRKDIELRVIPDRFAERFTEDGIRTFYSSVYEISQQSDRMGFRLSGPKVEHTDGADIITDGVIMGSVQIPPNGQPIIMMADSQTTGGYTRIANVISEDLPKLAQAGPGAKIRFVEVKEWD